MSQIRVGILRGGPSSEYEVSLKTGASVLAALPPDYKKEDILITKDGLWHFRGAPLNPLNLPDYIDVALLALHGEYGEDGQVQKMLEDMSLPFTGSGSLGSALGMNKIHTKKHLVDSGVRMPRHVLALEGDDPRDRAGEAFAKFSPPYVVKPADRGSSVGLFIVKNAHELAQAVQNCFQYSDRVLIEEFVRGKEATCGVVENLRGEEIYVLYPTEIVPPPKRAYDYDAKYQSEETNIFCPGRFSDEEKAEISRLAVLAHQKLGLRHYSRSDFIVSPRGIYYLETNTLPGLTDHSLLPKALSAVGIAYPDFLDHLVRLALER
ncbi:MAG: D-alanine--D-alanine ligase [Candidatus Vogelbacteria bacterium]|nr:D-alanine--D-alanine ligase [Candidatus Vogelbacteria bacterium]